MPGFVTTINKLGKRSYEDHWCNAMSQSKTRVFRKSEILMFEPNCWCILKAFLGFHSAFVHWHCSEPRTPRSPCCIPAHDCLKTSVLKFSLVFGVKQRKSYGFNLIHMFAVHIWQNSFLVGTFSLLLQHTIYPRSLLWCWTIAPLLIMLLIQYERQNFCGFC